MKFIADIPISRATVTHLKKEGLPSVIIFRLEYNQPQNVNSLLKYYLKEVKEDLLAGAIVIFEGSRVRVRRLPL